MAETNEFLAALFLLRMSHVDDKIVAQHVNAEATPPSIDFEGLRNARMWSSTEDVVIRAAQSLWSGGNECGVGEACQPRLEEAHFRAILEAMALRRGTQITFVAMTDEPS